MLVYRIAKKEYVEDLSGTGAALFGGRWNPKGYKMLYTAGTISLAYLEFLVHNYHLLTKTTVCMATIEIPDSTSLLEVKSEDLPDSWPEDPATAALTSKIGKEFILENRYYILKVPSAIVPGEFNYLLNPLYSGHSLTNVVDVIDPMKFDKRLWK